MIKVNIGNNLKRSSITLPHNTTLRGAFEQAGVEIGSGMISMDGSFLSPGDLNKTFADFGFDGTPGKDRLSLLVIVKADNANQ